jgi:hypothetical protein
MEWARILAYITGTVDQELLLRNGPHSPDELLNYTALTAIQI